MKLLPIVLALSAVGASAQTIYTGQADQERRDRNREEALANYRAGQTTASTTVYTSHPTAREETHKAANATRHAGHEAAEATRHAGHKVAEGSREVGHDVAEAGREVGHDTATAARKAGHRTAEAARNTTDKVESKVGPSTQAGKANPEGINPKGVSSASPTAPSNGVTK